MSTNHHPVEHQYILKLDSPHAQAVAGSSSVEEHQQAISPALFSLMASGTLPSTVDLRPWCSPVETQGKTNTCTGQAFAGAIEYFQNINNNFDVDGKFFNVSRLFTYYNERVLANNVDVDAGAYLHDGVKVLSTHGICREELWPYDPAKITVKPPPEAYADAATRKIKVYSQVLLRDIQNVKKVLAARIPVVFGFMAYEKFESMEAAATGTVNMPQPGEKCRGGHAVLMVGYDDTTQRVIVRNSWGPTWGKGGYFTLPYAYITNGRLTSDAWAIHE